MGYDYTGRRVRKQTLAGVTRYPFPGYEIDPTGVITKFIFVGKDRVAAKKSTGAALFYHTDHLGGVNVITDAAGLRVQLVEYEPWGMVSRSEGTVDPTYRFNGRELDDPEIGLYYYGGRYYSAALRRFISADPTVGSLAEPQGLNRYSYVDNNPVNYTDPSGFKKKKGFWGNLYRSFVRAIPALVVGIAVGVVVAAALVATAGAAGVVIAPLLVGAIAGAAGGAAAGVVNTAVNGGDLATNVLMGAALGGVAGAVGGPLATALQPALGGLGSAVATGAIVGGGMGGVSAAASGGNVLEGIAAGAITGAVVGAAVYGGYKAWNSVQQWTAPEPVSAQGAWGRGASIVRSTDVTGDPRVQFALREYGQWSPLNTDGTTVWAGQITGAPGRVGGVAISGQEIVLNVGDVGSFSDAALFEIMGHELTHVGMHRAVPDYAAVQSRLESTFGRNTPYEGHAESVGGAFRDYALGRQWQIRGQMEGF